jgi:hypothetical protein
MAQPFYLGLNMSGTVSAGAYTGGVIDFLIEAMDAWYAERERQTQQFGANYDQWTIPPHELQLAAMAGASGGGITTALSAAALTQKFAHIHDQTPGPGAALNTLFRSWVAEIDLSVLLGHSDLDANGGTVVSVLDSTPIRTIASHALKISDALPQRRPWVREGLKAILTVTNMTGVPYAIEPQTDSDSARTLYYADRRQFEVLWNAQGSGGETIPLDPKGGSNWQALADAAIATSAFPVVLAPQVLRRTAGEYNRRRWRIPQDDPKCGADAICNCETDDPMPPTWGLQDNAPVHTLNVDGGATNNSPFDCVRLELANLPPVVQGGHNLRDPKLADRAVINIAPLFTQVASGLPPPPATDIASLLFHFVDVLVNQSRIQGENLRLTADPQVASRWLIAPTAEISGIEPLAGATLNAFGGFVSQRFREHDYQLGRRNCQRFLMRYFGLPWDNAIMKPYNLSPGVQGRLDVQYGFDAETVHGAAPGPRVFPLIPVVPELRDEIKVARNAIQRDDLTRMGDLAMDRLKRVAKALLSGSGAGPFSDFAFNTAWLFIRDRLRDKLLTLAAGELAKQGFVS